MPEPGGPTAQAGIIYQNAVAALFMGRLCDDTLRLPRERVTSVRVEAPTSVDDTVVEFADEHQEFIQAKTNVDRNSSAWKKLWRDFDAEFFHPDFQRDRDRLCLRLGQVREDHVALEELCERAKRAQNHSEWWNGLNQSQRTLVKAIEPLLVNKAAHDAELREAEERRETEKRDEDVSRWEIERVEAVSQQEADQSVREGLVRFLAHVDVETLSLKQLERYAVDSMIPQSNVERMTLFRLLRDRVGGEARYRAVFARDALCATLEREDGVRFVAPPGIEELRTAVSACNGLLLQHKRTFGTSGRHVRREVSDDIVAWAHEKSSGGKVSVLLDRAGMGKTVVMGDVLRGLEDDNVTVLGIKADQQLSGVATRTDLRVELDLPDNVDRVVDRLAAYGPVVVLVDQIDALSLSLSRDQRALDVVLDMIARLCEIQNARVVVSCRAFDLNNDPKLRRIEMERQFSLPELTGEQVEGILRGQDVEIKALSPITQQLLRVPLHLDLFLRVAHGHETSLDPQHGALNVSTLQGLYTLLWDEVIQGSQPSVPPWPDRVRVVRMLTDHMNRAQRTSAPQALLATPENRHLEAAWNWLASSGIIVRRGIQWNFMHQTFFDYCYARHFVEDGGSLLETILAGDQGLLARRQLVQILAFLRGTDEHIYIRELGSIADADELRPHLRNLLFGWFGTLPDPTDAECSLARRLLLRSETRPALLRAMRGNRGWFARIAGRELCELLTLGDEALDAEVVPYLVSMVDSEQDAVVRALKPFVGSSDRWNGRIRWTLARIRDWHTLGAVELYEEAVLAMPLSEAGNLNELDDIVRDFPRRGSRSIRRVLDRSLDAYLQGDERRFYRGLLKEMPFHEHTLQGAWTAASRSAPAEFVDAILPWLERAVVTTSQPEEEGSSYFASDVLAHGWYDGLDTAQDSLVHAMVSALTAMAQAQPDEFRAVAVRLSAMRYQTAQQLLARVYRAIPEAYAGDALHFLLADSRRLGLGDNQLYESRALVSAIYPFLSGEERAELEAFILSYDRTLRYRDIQDLRWRGSEQLYLLQAIPTEYLTERGARYLAELERKFPGVRAVETPQRVEMQVVGSPIDENAHARMSEGAWLRAMRKYHGDVRHRDWNRGGARQLDASLQRLVKQDPRRFYRFALRVPDDVDDAYVAAFINGLADSDAPAEWLFDVVERFTGHPGREIRRTVAWALEKRCDDGLREDMMELLEGVVRGPIGDDETPTGENGLEASGVYINSDRGASFRTLMHALDRSGVGADKVRMWALTEYASSEPSTALRAGAIEQLLYRLMTEDRDRVAALFERLMDGHPELLCNHDTAEFLRFGSFQRFSRTRPFVRAMMKSDSDECAQAGARLACVAAISSPNALGSDDDLFRARALAELAINGRATLRRGVAQVYAYNMDSAESAFCAHELIRLVDDEDEDVRRLIADAFSRLRSVHEPEARRFVESFAGSRALADGEDDFAEFLWDYGPDEPAWALRLMETVLDNRRPFARSLRRNGGEDFVRLVLRVYNDPTADAALRETAMDAFDRLTEEYAYEAQNVLDEWDQR